MGHAFGNGLSRRTFCLATGVAFSSPCLGSNWLQNEGQSVKVYCILVDCWVVFPLFLGWIFIGIADRFGIDLSIIFGRDLF